MASGIDDLNELLENERGEVEAARVFISELSDVDQDLAVGANDMLETAQWACDGLYHRITQSHSTSTLDTSNLPEKMADKTDVKGRLKLLCKAHAENENRIKKMLKRDDLDNDTRSYLEDLKQAHEETADWCKSKLSEWKVNI